MAIYRPPKKRWPLAVAAALTGLVGGLAIGLLVGSNDPDPVVAAREVRSALVSAAGSLEVAAIEYEESVSSGEVTKEAEYEGARDALASSRARFEEVRAALQAVAPNWASDLASDYDDVESLMEARADASDVKAAIDDLRVSLVGQ